MKEFSGRPEQPFRALIEAELVLVEHDLATVEEDIKSFIAKRAAEPKEEVRQQINQAILLFYEQKIALIRRQDRLQKRLAGMGNKA